jgi:hypothetical protein
MAKKTENTPVFAPTPSSPTFATLPTLAEVKARHQQELRQLLLAALERCEWSIARSAAMLDAPTSSVQFLIKSCGLTETYKQHARPRGPVPKSQPVEALVQTANLPQRDRARAEKLLAELRQIVDPEKTR